MQRRSLALRPYSDGAFRPAIDSRAPLSMHSIDGQERALKPIAVTSLEHHANPPDSIPSDGKYALYRGSI